MARHGAHFWKKAPFIKLLLAFIAGIILQWHLQPDEKHWWLCFVSGATVITCFFFIPFFSRYKFSVVAGLGVALVFAAVGGLLARHKDIRKDIAWVGHYYQPGDGLVVSLAEPPVEKTKSFKADAKLQYLLRNGYQIPVTGRIIVYFRKDSVTHLNTLPEYGSLVVFKRPVQEIRNSGNPGGFDYKRYSLFKGVTHQVFLKQDEFEIIPGKKTDPFSKAIFLTRERVLNILRKNIPGQRELGLAEALLIGYKDDLEQSLVQSYTNTGVVHIIAISGLHIGLIYWLLSVMLKPLGRTQKTKWLRPLLIIAGLWGFSLLAGAQPSVLRSALMFSFIVMGETFRRKTSVYNTMAVSAFLLLCINPYWLWDVGFQLSYAAVLSIIIFMRPIYNWFYVKNKVLDFIWKLNAVTLAAQVLTLPLSIYHFHQFPSLFIISNFLAVPFSSAILIAEIILCAISFIPWLAALLGKGIYWCIRLMNTWVERVEQIPGSLWDGMYITLLQTVLLYLFVAGISYWLLEKSKKGLVAGLIIGLCFLTLRSVSFIESTRQQKLIVYNVPQKTAVDFISGRRYVFVGDPELLTEGFARNFHLKPSRTFHRISRTGSLNRFLNTENYILFNDKKIMMIDDAFIFSKTESRHPIDLLVVSKNPRLYFSKLATALDIKQVVFDGSAPAWKVNYWKKDCDSLSIPWHDVTMQGAFVMNLR